MFRNRRFTRKLPLGALLTLLSQAPFFLSLFLGGHSAVLMGVQLFTNLHLLRHFFFFLMEGGFPVFLAGFYFRYITKDDDFGPTVLLWVPCGGMMGVGYHTPLIWCWTSCMLSKCSTNSATPAAPMGLLLWAVCNDPY